MPAIPWRTALDGRDPEEAHRASTPLELLFDLCFVVAVAAAAAALHHDLQHGHLGALGTYAMVFFAIWWAWVNYSWFASAYDTGDVVFRLTTFVIMTGVLVLAAAIPSAAGAKHDFTLLVVGYVIMRLALIPRWLGVARDHPAVRQAAHRYAAGIAVVQLLWTARLWLPASLGAVSFIVLAALELAIPWFAEVGTGQQTPWHPEHIVERYELFTIIVLGEVILATTQAISASLDTHGLSADLLMVVVGGLLLVLSLWWLYFKRSMLECLRDGAQFFFGYAHYFVLGSVAAVGAALATAVNIVQHDTSGISHTTVALCLAVAVSVYLLSLGAIHAVGDRHPRALVAPAVVSAAALLFARVGTALDDHIGLSVLLVGLVVTTAVVDHQVRGGATTD